MTPPVNRYEQAIRNFSSVKDANGVVVWSEAGEKWLCAVDPWRDVQRVMEALPVSSDAVLAYAELRARVRRASPIASTVLVGCSGSLSRRLILISLAHQAGLVTETEAQSMSVAAPYDTEDVP